MTNGKVIEGIEGNYSEVVVYIVDKVNNDSDQIATYSTCRIEATGATTSNTRAIWKVRSMV